MSFVSDIIISSIIKILTIHLRRVLARNALTLTAHWSALKAILEAGARSCITSATTITSDVSQELRWSCWLWHLHRNKAFSGSCPSPLFRRKIVSFPCLYLEKRRGDCEIGWLLMSAKSFSCGTAAAVATFLWNVWSLAVFRSSTWLPCMISSALSPAFSRVTFEDSLAFPGLGGYLTNVCV